MWWCPRPAPLSTRASHRVAARGPLSRSDWQLYISLALTLWCPQISPQHMTLRLRVGQTESVRFQVSQSQHYPVDLYYLMDLSNSMSDDRENIVRLGNHIASAIENITKDCTYTNIGHLSSFIWEVSQTFIKGNEFPRVWVVIFRTTKLVSVVLWTRNCFRTFLLLVRKIVSRSLKTVPHHTGQCWAHTRYLVSCRK